MNQITPKAEEQIVEVSMSEISAAEGERAGVCAAATACVEATATFAGL